MKAAILNPVTLITVQLENLRIFGNFTRFSLIFKGQINAANNQIIQI